jgi:hypothetical protein
MTTLAVILRKVQQASIARVFVKYPILLYKSVIGAKCHHTIRSDPRTLEPTTHDPRPTRQSYCEFTYKIVKSGKIFYKIDTFNTQRLFACSPSQQVEVLHFACSNTTVKGSRLRHYPQTC